MLQPREQPILELFVHLVSAKRWRELEGKRRKGRLYTLKVVLTMALLQRIEERGTQEAVVERLAMGQLDQVVGKRCAGKVSTNTGGYAGANRRVSFTKVKDVYDTVVEQLKQRIEAEPKRTRPLLAWDGTSISLEHTREVLRQYPSTRNQHGEAHWGMLKVVTLHDLRSGIAWRPHWGPMYGKNAVSEQQLAEQALEQAPGDCVILGDGNFGVFYLAYKVDQSHRQLLFRLTPQRAKAMGATHLLPVGEQPFCWRPTRKDREKHRSLPADAHIQGRLITVQRKGFRHPLYLFSTQTESLATLVDDYGQRWKLELDLRSLKQTLHLDHLRSKTVEAIQKELLVAFLAYGLTRACMTLAATRANLSPRQLSFTAAYGLLEASLDGLLSGDAKRRNHTFDLMLDYMATCKLPKRSKRRSYPRAIWGFRPSFPPMETVRKPKQNRK